MSAESDVAFHLQEANADTTGVVESNTAKPKRVLTEAQRLAFLKAREARARNLAIKREQKLATEAAPAVRNPKPRAKRANSTTNQPVVGLGVGDGVGVGDGLGDGVGTGNTTEPKLVEVKVEPPPEPTVEVAAPVPKHPDPTEYAELVADIIYKKLNAEELPPEPPVPEPKPKKPRTRKPKVDRPPAPEPQPEPPAPETQSLAESVAQSEASSIQANNPFTSFQMPTKNFNWM